MTANRGGGEDNITVVVFELLGDDDSAVLPEDPPTRERALDEDTLTELDGRAGGAATCPGPGRGLGGPKGSPTSAEAGAGRLRRFLVAALVVALAAAVVGAIVVLLLWLGG